MLSPAALQEDRSYQPRGLLTPNAFFKSIFHSLLVNWPSCMLAVCMLCRGDLLGHPYIRNQRFLYFRGWAFNENIRSLACAVSIILFTNTYKYSYPWIIFSYSKDNWLLLQTSFAFPLYSLWFLSQTCSKREKTKPYINFHSKM